MSSVSIVEAWWAGLRAEGISVGPEELRSAIRVAESLDRAGQAGRLLATVQGVLTKNERELAILHAIAVPDPAAQLIAEESRAPRRFDRRIAWTALALVIVTGLVALFLILRDVDRPIAEESGQAAVIEPPSPPVENAGGLRLTSEARPPLRLEVVVPAAPLSPATWMLILAIPLLMAFGLYHWWRSRVPAWMHLAPDTVEHRLYNRLPGGGDASLFQSGALRTLGRALTSRTGESAGTVDIARTVAATARNAGLIEVIEERPAVDSPIHLAVERRSRDDHVSELYFRLADRLRAHGAYVQVTHFRDDLGSRITEGGDRVGAPQPEPGEARALLIIIGDGDGLFEADRARVRPHQLAYLARWPQRVLLSTRPVLLWGDREAALCDTNVAIAPAASRGLGAVARRLWGDEPIVGTLGVRLVTKDAVKDC